MHLLIHGRKHAPDLLASSRNIFTVAVRLPTSRDVSSGAPAKCENPLEVSNGDNGSSDAGVRGDFRVADYPAIIDEECAYEDRLRCALTGVQTS
jgi:hypothetical protein